MARAQYPSDHRRWFRVMEDILDDEKVAALDLADLGLFIKLLAVLNRQKSRDGIGRLDRFAACALARRERWAYARPAFDRLAAGGLVNVRYLDSTVEYLVPNWLKLQQLTPAQLRSDSDETPATTPTPTPKTKAPPVIPPERAVSIKGPPPDPWPPEVVDRLRAFGANLGLSSHAVDFALEAEVDRFEAGSTPVARQRRTLRGWEADVRNGLKKGYLLDGFEAWEAQRKRTELACAKQRVLDGIGGPAPAREISPENRETIAAMRGRRSV